MRSLVFSIVLVGLILTAVGVGATTLTRMTTGSQIETDPCFSPDGSQIALVINNDIWVMPSSGEPATTRLTSLGRHIEWPDWSPDGSAIVFLVDSHELWTVPAAGGEPVELTDSTYSEGTKRHPRWSPDGELIAFAWLSDSENYDIWAIPAGGGTPTQLTTAASHEADPDWSPDGTQIAFTSNRGGTWEIYTQPIAGGPATKVTSMGAVNDEVSWSPDGLWIAFVHRGSPAQIWIAPVSGDPARSVSGTADCYDGSPNWSPDGQSIVFDRLSSVPEDIWLATDLPIGSLLLADHPEILSVSPRDVGPAQNSVVVFCLLDSTGTRVWDEGVLASLSSFLGLGIFGSIMGLSDTTYQATYTAGPVPGLDSIYVYDPECTSNKYAWAVVDILPAPEIVSVKDVPDDQGGKVSVRWKRSAIDTRPSTYVTYYSIWRSILPVSGTMQGGVRLVTAADVGPDFSGPGHRFTVSGSNTYYWEWIANVPAHYFEGYSFTAATLMDSTSANPAWHYFLVSAHTPDQLVFRDSEPDSGYSVDNLAPDPPRRVSGQLFPDLGLLLVWAPNSEADLSHYAVYKGNSQSFVPSPSNRVGAPEDTTLGDSSFDPNVSNYYKISAWDIHENQSGYSLLRPEEITGAGAVPSVPAVTALEQNVPNPFNPVTVIRFAIASPGWVELRVYDVVGRPVRTLAEGVRAVGRYEVTWDGRDDGGVSVSSGVYMYELKAPGRVESKKMVLLK